MSRFGPRDFSDLQLRFYDGAVDDAAWPEIIAELKVRLNLSRVGFGWTEKLPTPAAPMPKMVMLHNDCDPYFEQLFLELGADNLFVPRLGSTPVGGVFTERSLVPRRDFLASRLFDEWFIPQGDHSGAVLKVEDSERSQAALMVQRGRHQPIFTNEDEADFLLLAPSLVHAMAIRRRLGENRLRRRGNAYDQMGLGFAVTDEAGRVLQCNTVAERYFGAGLGLSVRRGCVVTEHRSGLASLIAKAAKPSPGTTPGGDVVVTGGETHAPNLAVSVAPVSDGPSFGLPVQWGAMLLIQMLASRLPDDFERRTRDLFGLTAKEASLAAALSSGLSLKAAAEERFISMATARTQLAQIFRKTNTTQQSQVVSLLLRVLPVTH